MTRKEVEKIIKGLKPWVKKEEDNIFLTDYLGEKGLDRSNFINEVKEHPYLQKDWEIAKGFLKTKLMKLGLFRKTDSQMTKFILQNGYDMSEKSEETHKFENLNINDLVDFDEDDS